MLKSENRNLIELHVAGLLFGFVGLFGKLIFLPPIIIVLGRVLFATLFLFVLLLYFRQSLKLNSRKDYLYLILLGVILAIHWIAFFQSIQISTVAVGVITFATFPIFVTFLEPLIAKEKIKAIDASIALVTFIGVVLIIPKFEISNSITQGVAFGLVAAVTFAILSILNKQYVRKYSSLVITFYQDAFAAILLLPALFLVPYSFQMRDLLLLVILGIFFTGVAHTLFVKGMTHVKAQTASIIVNLEPVYGVALAAIVLGEIPEIRTVVGGILILAATMYATINSRS